MTQQSPRPTIPRWTAAIIWPLQILLFYAGAPAGLAGIGPRHGWRGKRPGPINLLGLAILAPGFCVLASIIYRHLAHSPGRIKLPQPAPPYLLTGGPYRWSRNPMYLAGIITWLGWAIYYGNLAVLTGALSVWSAIAWLVVPFEEKALESRFGPTYRQYQALVPRWLGRPGRSQAFSEKPDF